MAYQSNGQMTAKFYLKDQRLDPSHLCKANCKNLLDSDKVHVIHSVEVYQDDSAVLNLKAGRVQYRVLGKLTRWRGYPLAKFHLRDIQTRVELANSSEFAECDVISVALDTMTATIHEEILDESIAVVGVRKAQLQSHGCDL